MADKLMYFGTRERMTWIPCPVINAGLGSTRWLATGNFLNGGAYQRQSTVGRKNYSFAWNPQAAEDLYELSAYFDGIYGSGPYYFVDPFAADTNILPSFLAAPVTMAGDAPDFGGTQRVLRTSAAPNTAGYPVASAQLSVSAGFGPYKSYSFPVPPGYTLHLGAHGTAAGTSRVIVKSDGQPDTNLTLLPTNTMQRTNATFAGGSWYSVTVGGEGTLTLSGLIGQILPDGSPEPIGNFISGQGNTGVRLAANPSVTGYSAALKNASVGMTAEFVETGAWEQ